MNPVIIHLSRVAEQFPNTCTVVPITSPFRQAVGLLLARFRVEGDRLAPGSQKTLRSRFAAVRVRPAHRDYYRTEPYPEECS
jgi:hypothetical protein